MQQIPVSLLTLIAGVFVGLVSLWVGQNYSSLLPVQASLQAPLVDKFFGVMLTIGTALFLIVEGAILIFLFVFRRRKGDDTDGLPIEGNLPLEVFWTAVPALIVICLGIYSVDIFSEMGGLGVGSHQMATHNHSSVETQKMKGSAIAATLSDATDVESDVVSPPVSAKIGIGGADKEQNKAADLVVDVKGMQFAWIFNYPDTNVTAGELHIPVGADVQLNLSASDVIHSFWVPQFRLKQDAIPGIATQLRFVATKPGTYSVVCAELCGGYHGSMRSQVIVHTPDEFESWLEENRIAVGQQVKEVVAAVDS